MIDSPIEPKYVRYPRKTFGLDYGSLERLESLGEFCRSIMGFSLGLVFLELLSIGCIADFTSSRDSISWPLFTASAYGVYKVGDRLLSRLAFGMGWSRAVSKLVALSFVALSLSLLARPAKMVALWAAPLFAVLVVVGVGLYIANLELAKYGMKISPFTISGPETEFDRIVAKRREYEENPNRTAENMYAGDPPA